jgi:hypothetical protein
MSELCPRTVQHLAAASLAWSRVDCGRAVVPCSKGCGALYCSKKCRLDEWAMVSEPACARAGWPLTRPWPAGSATSCCAPIKWTRTAAR